VKEVELLEKDGDVNMKSRGLGDSIARFTKATGIKKAGQEALNNLVPYNKSFKLRDNGNKKN